MARSPVESGRAHPRSASILALGLLGLETVQYIYIHIFVHVYVYVYDMYIHVHTHIQYQYLSIYLYIYVYVYIYIHIHSVSCVRISTYIGNGFEPPALRCKTS